jgi:septum site-determining protein MinD
VARRLQGEEVPLIDPSQERQGLRARLGRLMQTKIF